MRVFRHSHPQPLQKYLRGGRQDENRHRLRKHLRELRRALHVDIHQDVTPRLENLQYLAAKRAVQVPVDFSGLGEFPSLPLREEVATRYKVIVFALNLAWPGLPGG